MVGSARAGRGGGAKEEGVVCVIEKRREPEKRQEDRGVEEEREDDDAGRTNAVAGEGLVYLLNGDLLHGFAGEAEHLG